MPRTNRCNYSAGLVECRIIIKCVPTAKVGIKRTRPKLNYRGGECNNAWIRGRCKSIRRPAPRTAGMDELKKEKERERERERRGESFYFRKTNRDMMPSQQPRASCLRVIINYRSCRFSISRCIFGGLIIPLFVLSRWRKRR